MDNISPVKDIVRGGVMKTVLGELTVGSEVRAAAASAAAELTAVRGELPQWSYRRDDPNRLKFYMQTFPGGVKLRSQDLVVAAERDLREERNRERERRINLGDSGVELERGHDWSRAAIMEFSPSSRRNMTLKLCQVNWEPFFVGNRLPMFLTLTLPDDWEAVAPSAAVMAQKFDRFCRMYERAFGERFQIAWKRETQRRGAFHYHGLCAPLHGRSGDYLEAQYQRRLAEYTLGMSDARPRRRKIKHFGLTFAEWAAVTWTEILGVEGEEEVRKSLAMGVHIEYLTDATPAKMAGYFAKHGLFSDKQYQNEVPQVYRDQGSVGRFWGIRGLEYSVTEFELTPEEALWISRRARAVSSRRVIKGEVKPVLSHPRRPRRRRMASGAYKVQYRRQTVRPKLFARPSANHGGFLIMDDPLAFLEQCIRYLRREHENDGLSRSENFGRLPLTRS